MKSGSRYLLAVLVLGMLLSGAQARATADPGADLGLQAESTTPDDEENTPVDASAPRVASPEVCEITGLVAKLQNVQATPYRDGTPAAFADVETRINVRIEGRLPHRRPANAAAESPCVAGSLQGREIAYKLCSPTAVREGDRIRATEGLMPIDTAGTICLFDIAVIP